MLIIYLHHSCKVQHHSVTRHGTWYLVLYHLNNIWRILVDTDIFDGAAPRIQATRSGINLDMIH